MSIYYILQKRIPQLNDSETIKAEFLLHFYSICFVAVENGV